MTRGRPFAFWFGAIWLFAGAPLLTAGIYLGIDAYGQQERFEREGRVAQGMVLTKSIARRRNSGGSQSTSYRVGFRFHAPDGTVVKRETAVSGGTWDRLVEREPIQVTFLPDDPRTNRIEGETSDWMLALIFTGLGLVFAPIGAFVLARGLRPRQQHQVDKA